MTQYVKDSKITKGHLELDDIPLDDNTEVKVILIPKTNPKKMSYTQIQKMMSGVKGDLSEDIIQDRKSR